MAQLKRARLGLTLVNPPPEEPALDITNTMTLVVDVDGTAMRVKDTGIRRDDDTGATPCRSSPQPSEVEALMNRIRYEDLRVLEVLGHGSQGKVRKAVHQKTGELFAIKSIAFSEDKEAMRNVVGGELRRVDALKHPSIVSSYEAYFREGKLYLVLEYMDCGTMSSLLKANRGGFPENIVSYVALHLLAGLQHLHASGVIHRDLKPANVLADSTGAVKISDFGVAKDFSRQSSMETLASVGSTPYMSPERLKAKPYSFSCDIWSCGITIAECAIGSYPFGEMKNHLFDLCQAIAGNHATVDWNQDVGRQFSAELRGFVDVCLRPVESRPTATQLLTHPFLQLGRNCSPSEIGQWFKKLTERTSPQPPPSF